MRFYCGLNFITLIEVFTSIFILIMFCIHKSIELPTIALQELQYDYQSVPISDLDYSPKKHFYNSFKSSSSYDFEYVLDKGYNFTYTFIDSNLTYQNLLKDSVKNGENCKEGYKKCGILDTNNTTMCIKTEQKCPINFMIQSNSAEILKDYPQYHFTTVDMSEYSAPFFMFYTNEATDKPILSKFIDNRYDKTINVYPVDYNRTQYDLGINSYTMQYYSNYTKVIGSTFLYYRPFIPVDQECINRIGLSYTNPSQYEIRKGIFKVVERAMLVFLISGLIITAASNILVCNGMSDEFIFNELIYYKLPLFINNLFILCDALVQFVMLYTLHINNQCANQEINSINSEIETSLVERKEELIIIIIVIVSSMFAKFILWFIIYGCLPCCNKTDELLEVGPIVDIKDTDNVITSETANQLVDKPTEEVNKPTEEETNQIVNKPE